MRFLDGWLAKAAEATQRCAEMEAAMSAAVAADEVKRLSYMCSFDRGIHFSAYYSVISQYAFSEKKPAEGADDL